MLDGPERAGIERLIKLEIGPARSPAFLLNDLANRKLAFHRRLDAKNDAFEIVEVVGERPRFRFGKIRIHSGQGQPVLLFVRPGL
jgi:hypothetical protein